MWRALTNPISTMHKSFKYTLFFIGFLLLSLQLKAQVGNRFFMQFGLENYAGNRLWPQNAHGHYMGLQYERRLPYRFGVGVGLSHHFVTNGNTAGNHFIEYPDGTLVSSPYLLITKNKRYAYSTAQDEANLNNTGIIPLIDHINKFNSFKLNVGISYDFLKSTRNDLQLVILGDVNMTSTTYSTDNWEGIFTSPGLPVEKVRYIIPYEQRAFGLGYAVDIRYLHTFKNEVFAGLQLGRNNLLTLNGGVYHTVGLFVGKRFQKNKV